MALFCPSGASDASQHQRWEFSDGICNISKVHISISKSLSTRVNDPPTLLQVPLWMSAKHYSCPRKGLLSGNAHPAAPSSAPRAACLALVCAARSVACVVLGCRGGEPDSMTFPAGRITSQLGQCWKEPSIVWHANHDAACLAPLNGSLPDDSSQESSLFTNVIPNILCAAKHLSQKKKADRFYRNTLSEQLWLLRPSGLSHPLTCKHLSKSSYRPETVPSILHRRIHLILNRKTVRQELA